MAKKGAKRIKKQKKTTSKISKTGKVSKDVEKLNAILIENFVNLQKALTNLTVKFDNLADQISKLLQLFEISAKSFAEKLSTGTPDLEKDREFLEKLNKLLEQNKVIAKGLTLMEEKIRERVYGQPSSTIKRQQYPQQYPRPIPRASTSTEGYLPSSLSQEKEKATRELE